MQRFLHLWKELCEVLKTPAWAPRDTVRLINVAEH